MNSLLYNAQKLLKYSNQRHLLLSNNVARANIPNQQAFDLAEFKIENNKSNLAVRVTNHNHLLPSHQHQARLVKPKDSDTTINGNNIDIAKEMSKISQNNTDFKLATNIYSKITDLIKLSSTSK